VNVATSFDRGRQGDVSPDLNGVAVVVRQGASAPQSERLMIIGRGAFAKVRLDAMRMDTVTALLSGSAHIADAFL
jgi:hypothetical protein